jgi:hypothetical protein
MDFDKRLQRAIVRGQRTRDVEGRAQAERALSTEELKNLHSKVRLDLSERIEQCLRKLADHFPGFRYESVFSEAGWGAKISRDDLAFSTDRRESRYSRLELLIRPLGPAQIVELAAKGTVRNKEVFNRTHYQQLSEVDVDSFSEMIDLWVLEYAEQYAARG